MPELGKYAATVLSAYGISLGLLAWLILQSLWKSRRMKRKLDAAEARRQRNG
ncbi:MAG: heme exporter protein CcmD [Rhodobacteraceae bacterium]|nr:heme exporter protein CcmD [Paracoccaceae bacterium]